MTDRVGQVWEFYNGDYIAVIVRTHDGGHAHDLVWLIQGNQPGDGELYPCSEIGFGDEFSEHQHRSMKRLA